MRRGGGVKIPLGSEGESVLFRFCGPGTELELNDLSPLFVTEELRKSGAVTLSHSSRGRLCGFVFGSRGEESPLQKWGQNGAILIIENSCR